MTSDSPFARFRAARSMVALFGIWTLVAAGFLALLLYYATVEEREVALNRAVASYHKDLAYRSWASERGGVYVPLDAKTPANPYLANRPDREITTTEGKVLTLVNPAYMTRMVHELETAEYGSQGHLTSLRPIRPENAPDPWERKALEAFERGAREFSEMILQGDRLTLRYMGALLVDQSCLACHAQQGYQVGQVRGGLSVTVPVGTGPAFAGLTHRAISALIVAIFWLLGGAGIAAWTWRRVRSEEVQRGLMQDLQASSEQFQTIRDTSPDSLWFLDGLGQLQWVNDTYCRLSGYDRSELLGRPIAMVEAVERPEDTARRIASIKASPGGGRFRTRHRAKDGHLIHFEVTTAYIPSKSQIVAFLRDITEEVLAAQHLRESEARFRQLFESSPAPMYIRREGRIVQANQAIATLLEADSPAALLNLPVTSFLHPDFHAVVAERIQAALDLNRPAPPLEEVYQTLQGRQVWVEVQAIPLDLPGGRSVLIFALDLTERRRADEERRRLEGEVQHAQKLESLGSLAGGIAHDMNNVLAAILGMSSLLQMKAGEDDSLQRSLRTIEKAAGRGRDLVKGLTDFARKDLQEARLLDLNALVRDELELLARTSRQRFTFEVRLAEGLPSILGEPSTLSSAFMNLCVNAFDAMPGGGTLRVGTRAEGQRVVLEVADSGQGIPPEVLPRITEPFFTTKPAGRGTGLGLAMVHGAVKAHGGTLDIQSEVGKGTCITLGFPAACADAGAGTAAAPAPSGEAGRALRILLVDDDALIRGVLPDMLMHLGHQVEMASSGLEAIRRLEAGLEADLIILDHHMPGLSGAETLPRILRLRPGLRVLVATGFLDNDLRLLLAEFPAVRAVQKPFSVAELRRVIQDSLDGADSGLSGSS